MLILGQAIAKAMASHDFAYETENPTAVCKACGLVVPRHDAQVSFTVASVQPCSGKPKESSDAA